MKAEMFNLAICKGHLVAFTYGRISSNDVLNGLHKYDIQSSDDGFEPSAIKPSILVHHWGTLVSRVPLPLDESGWLMLDDDKDFIELNRMILTQKEYAELPEDVIHTFLNLENTKGHIYDTHQI